jgi:hypothetical protein
MSVLRRRSSGRQLNAMTQVLFLVGRKSREVVSILSVKRINFVKVHFTEGIIS